MYKILNAEKLSANVFLMDVEAPRVAKHCLPGQFVIVKMDEVGERIPLTICDYDAEKGTVTIVFQPAGASTTRMAQLKAGDYFEDFVGPLGQPSELCHEDLEELKKKKIVFVAGGVGSAPVYPQVKWMHEHGIDVDVIEGSKTKSLLILDEIGRGTSTFDGLSIAWAVVEYISDSKLLGAKTLFATHYHELTELEGKIENVNNYCIAVKEKGDDIVFLRKIVKGGADKSYGIQVAKLAGVPDLVINRAKEIVEELSDEDITSRVSEIAAREHTAKKKGRSKKYDEVDIAQMSLFDTVKDDDVLNELKEIDVTNLTPIDALNTLYRLQNKLKNRW